MQIILASAKIMHDRLSARAAATAKRSLIPSLSLGEGLVVRLSVVRLCRLYLSVSRIFLFLYGQFVSLYVQALHGLCHTAASQIINRFTIYIFIVL